MNWSSQIEDDNDTPDQPEPGLDMDGDGLEDFWEYQAGAKALLDWTLYDTDGNGEPDSQADPDGDGLTNLEEYAVSRLLSHMPQIQPHPLRIDLLVELDLMAQRTVPDQLLAKVGEAFASLGVENMDGSTGVGVHFYRDQIDINPQEFDGSFEQRHAFLQNHGSQLDDGKTPDIPLDKMIHIIVAARRTDLAERGGEVVTEAGGDIEKSGLFLYLDVIYELFPQCESTGTPARAPITPEEMIVATLVHEMGHVLQLGHDTMEGGAINYYNIMSVPQSCISAQERAHGIENQDATLGNTESISAPRFSNAAADLMKWTQKISVDTATIHNDIGYEM